MSSSPEQAGPAAAVLAEGTDGRSFSKVEVRRQGAPDRFRPGWIVLGARNHMDVELWHHVADRVVHALAHVGGRPLDVLVRPQELRPLLASEAGVEVVAKPALVTTAVDVLEADGYLLGTPANFGYMSGALKHFFDSTFLQVGGALGADGSAASDSDQGATRGRPFGLYVHGRYDTHGAVRSVLSIVQALQWRQAAGVLEVLGDVDDEHREAAYELGGTIAALVSPDI